MGLPVHGRPGRKICTKMKFLGEAAFLLDRPAAEIGVDHPSSSFPVLNSVRGRPRYCDALLFLCSASKCRSDLPHPGLFLETAALRLN